jgi:hypothetical protein
MITNGMILSAHTGEPVTVRFAMVGKGKALHYSPSNDETLCGKGIRTYVDPSEHTDAPLCKRCAAVERVRSDEYAEYLSTQESATQATVPHPPTWPNMVDSPAHAAEYDAAVSDAGDASFMAPEFDRPEASECYFGCGVAPVAVFVDHAGVTQGVCAAHRERVEGATHELPTLPVVEAQEATQALPDAKEAESVAWQSAFETARERGADYAGACDHADQTVKSLHARGVLWSAGEADNDAAQPFTLDTPPVPVRPFAVDVVADVVGEGAHRLSRYVESEGKGTLWECTQCRCIGTNGELAQFPCAGSEPVEASESEPVEDAPQGVPTVCVTQNTPGMGGAQHYHTPGCRDIKREMKRFGITPEYVQEFPFASVAEILAFEYGDIASDSHEENTPEWWSEVLNNASYDSRTGSGMGVKIMPCLTIPMGTDNEGNPLQDKGSFYCFGFKAPTPEAVTQAVTEYKAETVRTMANGEATGAFTLGHPLTTQAHNTCDIPECEACAAFLYRLCQDNHTNNPEWIGKSCTTCKAYETFGHLAMYRGVEGAALDSVMRAVSDITGDAVTQAVEAVSDAVATVDAMEAAQGDTMATVASLTTGAGFHTVDAPQGDDAGDAGFVETMVTVEVHLSVTVDENTGAKIDLGWVVLDMNAAQANDHARIADAYGKAHGEGTPRYGWESIITVHAVEQI